MAAKKSNNIYENTSEWITSPVMHEALRRAVFDWILPEDDIVDSFQGLYTNTGQKFWVEVMELPPLEARDELLSATDADGNEFNLRAHFAFGWIFCALKDFIGDKNPPIVNGEKLDWFELAKKQFALQREMGLDQEQLLNDLLSPAAHCTKSTTYMVKQTIDGPLKKLYQRSLRSNNDATWPDVRQAFVSHLHQEKFTQEIPRAFFDCYQEGDQNVNLRVGAILDDALDRAAFTVNVGKVTLPNWHQLEDSDKTHIYNKVSYHQGLFSNMPDGGICLIKETEEYTPGVWMKESDGSTELKKPDNPIYLDFKYTKEGGFKTIKYDGTGEPDLPDLVLHALPQTTARTVSIDFEVPIIGGGYKCTPSRWQRMHTDIKLAAQMMTHMLGSSYLGPSSINLGKRGIPRVVELFCRAFIESGLNRSLGNTWFDKSAHSCRLRNAAALCTLSHQADAVEVKFVLGTAALEGLIAVPFQKGMHNDRITNTLKKRIGVLLEPEFVHRDAAEKKIADLYNRRSKFIHASPEKGLEINDDSCEELFTLLSSVMLSLIYFENFNTRAGHNEESAKAKAEKDKEMFRLLEEYWIAEKPMEDCFAPIKARKLWVPKKCWNDLADPLR